MTKLELKKIKKDKEEVVYVLGNEHFIELPEKLSNHEEFRINQFKKFYHFLMKNSPKDYIPWIFPCEKEGKNPAIKKIIELSPESKGSWHDEKARLTEEQAIQVLKEGYNLGISARDNDSLIIGDIDEPKYFNQLPEDTLTSTSRKRCGGHFFGWNKDGSAKKNIATDYGELRSFNQYVLTPGSYVPYNLSSKKDKTAFDKLPEEAKRNEYFGYYTVRNAQELKQISFEDLPKFFLEEEIENELFEEKNTEEFKKDEKEVHTDGKYSQLFDLKVSDIIGLIPSSKRKGHPLHESDTDANFSLSQDGTLGFCWRHMVSLNAVQYLCVKNGYAKCEHAGTPFKRNKNEQRTRFSRLKGDKKSFEIAYQEALKLELITEWKEKENTDLVNGVQKEFLYYSEKWKTYSPDVERVSNYILGKYKIRCVVGKDKEKLWLADKKGVWTPKAEGIIKSECEKVLKSYAKINPINEIIAKIKRRTLISLEAFEQDNLNFLNLNNGVWDIENKVLLPHDSKYNFRFIIEVDKKDEIQKDFLLLKFLEETLYPQDIPVMQELFGFCLYREYFLKKAFIFLGESDTGKTVTLNTLIDFIGNENTSGLSLQKISQGSDFSKFSLKDKMLNAYDDLSSKDLNDGGNFKVSTGGGYITAEEKFGDMVKFKNFAKHVFPTNKVPPVKDNDDMAYFGRFIVIRFDNVPDKKDPFLKKKLVTPTQKTLILNWALEGLYRLLERGEFSYNKTPEEVKTIMEMSGDTLIQFSDNVLYKSEGKRITKEEMYELYLDWCSKNNKPALSKEQLGRNLHRKLNYIVPKELKINGKTTRVWENVGVKEGFKLQRKSQETLLLDKLKEEKNETPPVHKI